MIRFHPGQLVVSCEHASNRIPSSYRNLGLGVKVLGDHVAWDIGAPGVAAALSKRFGAPYFAGRYSRLLVDLNRSEHSRDLIVARNHGYVIPGNRDVDEAERERRIAKYHRPYQERVRACVNDVIERTGACLHISVHSFTPSIDGTTMRNCDIGLLYHPSRPRERSTAAALIAPFAKHGYRVRKNYPYRGTMDGIQTAMKKSLADRRYVGIEIETNQALYGSRAGTARLRKATIEAIAAVLGRHD